MSNEGPVAGYVRRARGVARRASRKAAGPVVKVRRQGADLRRTSAELKDVKARLKAARNELQKVKDELRTARAERDTRRAGDDVESVIKRVRGERLTFLTIAALRDLALAAQDVEANHLPGLIIEAGTALGGSAIVLAAAKGTERPMKVYDVFGMIPEPGERDGEDVHERYRTIAAGEAKGFAGDTYYGYHDNLYDEVVWSFTQLGMEPAAHHVELVKGRFEDTIDLDEPVALAHLDGDWYASTMTCLERIAPLLVSGGRIVVDDYAQWSGCRQAVDDYFRDRHMDFRFEQHNRLHVVRR